MTAFLLCLWAGGPAWADDDGRFRIINIKRDIDGDKGPRTVNGTMMVDSRTGRSWILDEERGRWVPVGFRAAKLGNDVTVLPGAAQ
ncbi:MAG: hypothetical protein CMM61_09470 [Rhodospirillaceae bacterium]|nr:hypothetical protein [Rhodospirillaceae bacterium]|tara:strand:- start:820 stop:1077 length:258 start_codon:yes stop_codon:yes gene_type:complete